MKRSAFGFKEWCEFMPDCTHEFNMYAGKFILKKGEHKFGPMYANTVDENMRKSVEAYCAFFRKPLPWEPDKPDFSTWSRDECEEYFKEQKCNWHTYSNTSGRLMGGTYSAIMLDDKFYSHFGDAINGPSLKNYQAAAEYVWKKVNKQEEENVRS